MRILPNGIAILDKDTHASKWIEEQGTLFYDGNIKGKIMPLLKPGDVCVDAGAMLGAYSRGMKDAVGPSGKVYSFEPNPIAFECLKHNCPDCDCAQYGLSSFGEERAMRENSNAGATHFVHSHYGGLVRAFRPLDSLMLDRLDFFKIDVEGMEPQVLAGATQTLVRFRPIIYVEINHEALERANCNYLDVAEPLLKIGYRPCFLEPEHNLRWREWSQLDMLFMP